MADASVLIFVKANDERKVLVILDKMEQPDMAYAVAHLREIGTPGREDVTPGPSTWGDQAFEPLDRVAVMEFNGYKAKMSYHGTRIDRYHLLAAAEYLQGQLDEQHASAGVVRGMMQMAQMQQEMSIRSKIALPGNGGGPLRGV
ncbi:MAG: hypothetical protein ACLQGJ_05085 [Candidatus Dormibacteria bacterium]